MHCRLGEPHQQQGRVMATLLALLSLQRDRLLRLAKSPDGGGGGVCLFRELPHEEELLPKNTKKQQGRQKESSEPSQNNILHITLNLKKKCDQFMSSF